jgi:DNA transposition AAA+ family ATPase
MNRQTRRTGTFITTREHKRFVEFANTVRRNATIGLCHGRAGVGKTLSARRYAHWDLIEPLVTEWGKREDSDVKVYATSARARTLFYTAPIGGSLSALRKDIQPFITRLSICIDSHERPEWTGNYSKPLGPIELVIIDEAERLTMTGLEFLRDQFDCSDAGLILIGMPGIEKRMSQYPQLYSRIGFVHEYPPLSKDEMQFVLQRQWKKLGFGQDDADFTDARAAAAIIRLTAGNFRLLQRLFMQIERIARINEIAAINEEVVAAAAQTLVIGNAN